MPFELFENIQTQAEARAAATGGGGSYSSGLSGGRCVPGGRGRAWKLGMLEARPPNPNPTPPVRAWYRWYRRCCSVAVVDDNLGFAKDRTVSRLTEMQSEECVFLSLFCGAAFLATSLPLPAALRVPRRLVPPAVAWRPPFACASRPPTASPQPNPRPPLQVPEGARQGTCARAAFSAHRQQTEQQQQQRRRAAAVTRSAQHSACSPALLRMLRLLSSGCCCCARYVTQLRARQASRKGVSERLEGRHGGAASAVQRAGDRWEGQKR